MKTTGILLRVGATFFFTLMVIAVKMLADSVPLGQIVFFRSAVALIPLVLYLILTDSFPSGLSTKRPVAHIVRCLMGCIALFTSFASLAYLPMSHATIIGFLAPILSVILARFTLGEEVSKIRWFAVTFGFLGVLTLVLPKLTAITLNQAYLLGLLLAFSSAFFTSGAKIQTRSLALTENAGAIAFYFALTCSIAGLGTIFWGWIQPNIEQLIWLIGAGLAGGVAHIMMTLALQYDEVSKLAPFEYLSLIFAVLADVLLFNIIPEISFYISSVIILFAMWLITFKDRK